MLTELHGGVDVLCVLTELHSGVDVLFVLTELHSGVDVLSVLTELHSGVDVLSVLTELHSGVDVPASGHSPSHFPPVLPSGARPTLPPAANRPVCSSTTCRG